MSDIGTPPYVVNIGPQHPSTHGVFRLKVTLDGETPGASHGLDVDEAGNGVVREHRLYQLVRHDSGARERTFTITFLDPGVEAYAFTFG